MTATTKESYSKNAKSSSAIENERPNIIKKTRVPILPGKTWNESFDTALEAELADIARLRQGLDFRSGL